MADLRPPLVEGRAMVKGQLKKPELAVFFLLLLLLSGTTLTWIYFSGISEKR
jgi:hypothetical protein